MLFSDNWNYRYILSYCHTTQTCIWHLDEEEHDWLIHLRVLFTRNQERKKEKRKKERKKKRKKMHVLIQNLMNLSFQFFL